MRRRARLRSLGLAVLATFASACRPDADSVVHVAMSASPAAEVLELARTRGFFAEEGIQVRLVEHTSAGDVLRAFERRQVDGMLASLVEVLHARDEAKVSPRVVLVADAGGVRGALIAAKPIAGIADVRGLRVAAEPRSASFHALLDALDGAGLSLFDVTFVAADPTDMARLLDDGTVDAVVTYPPWTQHLARGGTVLEIGARGRKAAPEVLAFDEAFVRDRPGDVAAVLRAWNRALTVVESDPAAAAQIMALRERLSARDFGRMLARARLLHTDEQAAWLSDGGELAQAAARASRLLRDNGQLTGPDRSAEPLTQKVPGAAGGAGRPAAPDAG